jgi:hypothetical protein
MLTGATPRAELRISRLAGAGRSSFPRLLIIFESVDEVLHGIATLIQAIKGATADQVH